MKKILSILICLLFFATVLNVSAVYISHVPIKTVFGTQIETLYVEGRFPGLECVAVSGDVFRDILFGLNGVDPYLDSISVGLEKSYFIKSVKPYSLFCGYDGKMVGVGNSAGVCYING